MSRVRKEWRVLWTDPAADALGLDEKGGADAPNVAALLAPVAPAAQRRNREDFMVGSRWAAGDLSGGLGEKNVLSQPQGEKKK